MKNIFYKLVMKRQIKKENGNLLVYYFAQNTFCLHKNKNKKYFEKI